MTKKQAFFKAKHDIDVLTQTIKLHKEREKELVRCLKGCVEWIEPVMDGFGVSLTAAARIKILKPSKEVLAKYGDKNG